MDGKVFRIVVVDVGGLYSGCWKKNEWLCYFLFMLVIFVFSKCVMMCEFIFDYVYVLVICDGLEGLFIGNLVVDVGMFKSGVFVYFGFCEDL